MIDLKKGYNLPLFIFTVGMFITMFTVGLIVGTYIASGNVEMLAK